MAPAPGPGAEPRAVLAGLTSGCLPLALGAAAATAPGRPALEVDGEAVSHGALDGQAAHLVGLSMAPSAPCTWGCAIQSGWPPWSSPAAATAPHPSSRASFRAECEALARAFERDGAGVVAERYALGPARVQLQNKDPRGWRQFVRMLAEHSSLGWR